MDNPTVALKTLYTLFKKEVSVNASLKKALIEEQKASGKSESEISDFMSQYEQLTSTNAESFDAAYKCVNGSLEKQQETKNQLHNVVNKCRSIVQKLVQKNTNANKKIKQLEQEQSKKNHLIRKLKNIIKSSSGRTDSHPETDQYKSEIKSIKEENLKKLNSLKAEKEQIVQYYEKKIHAEKEKREECNRVIQEKSEMINDIRNIYLVKEKELKNNIAVLNSKYVDKIKEMEEKDSIIKSEKLENVKLKRENKKLFNKIFDFISLTKEMKEQIIALKQSQ